MLSSVKEFDHFLSLFFFNFTSRVFNCFDILLVLKQQSIKDDIVKRATK